jgi:hypothetical protein
MQHRLRATADHPFSARVSSPGTTHVRIAALAVHTGENAVMRHPQPSHREENYHRTENVLGVVRVRS